MKIGTLTMAFGSALAFCLTCLPIQAEEALKAEPLPPDFVLKTGAPNSSWQIAYEYDADMVTAKDKAPPTVSWKPYGQLSFLPARKVIVVRTAPFWHSVTTDTSGGKMEQWSDGAIRLFVQGSMAPVLVPRAVSSQFPDFGVAQAPDVDWIKPVAYQGVEVSNGQKYYVFGKNGLTAYVDVRTRLLRRWQSANETRTLEQLSPPDGSIRFPDSVERIIRAFKHPH